MFYLAPEGRRLIYFSFAIFVFLSLIHPLFSIPFLVIFFFLVYFFRDPEREIPQDNNLILSPADGRVLEVVESYDNRFLKSEAKKVSIFMSLLNVHVNRSPIDGKVVYRDYVRGFKKMAFGSKSSKLNERSYLGIEGKIKVLLVQVAGFVARRIVTYPKEGDFLRKGDRIGIIKFGSRVDLYLPTSVELFVKVGDRVKAGETILGVINKDENEERKVAELSNER
ncbi:MAG: phosphatidylserine decarboxylase family protein [Synergistetes bacterium]|nr:phosphatidylserine decarboxylase family protein [Synergistota bacterium]MDW8191776.1 phosphatidylserine decarboxylase family protein [Synergistota bacterium]